KLDHAAKHVQQVALASLRVHLWCRTLGVWSPEELDDQRQVLVESLLQQQEPARDLLARATIGVVLLNPEVGAQALQNRKQRDRLAVCLALGLIDRDLAAAAELGGLVAEAALADPGLAD